MVLKVPQTHREYSTFTHTLNQSKHYITVSSFEVKQVYCCILLQEYESAERCVDRILQMEPNNYQAKQLKELIIKKLRRGYYLHTCIDPCMHACIMSYNVAGIYLVVFMQRLL